METTQNDNQGIEENKKAIRQDAKGLVSNLKRFILELLDFRADTDREATIDAIVKDIPLKGATAWILICSIFVASIGLNANSTAVVIGAMLISPLMGPILGIGLSIAINDIDTLKKSLINFGVMIVLSVFTAFLFFWLFPLREESSELLARTKPDIRDVLIAFFGGLALIIARTKKGTIASVIFGVAIATALMPPLCTVGYGLAEAFIGNLKGLAFAGGAFYLFLINTIFIALATFIALKVLRFPMLKYANSIKRKRIARLASIIALIVMIFPAITFYQVLKETSFKNDAQRYIANELSELPNASYIKKYATYHYVPKGESSIEIISFGNQPIEATTADVLRGRLKAYSSLQNTQLLINQGSNDNDLENEMRYMLELRSRDSLDITSKTQKIAFLEKEVAKLSKLEKEQIPFQNICDEAKINYENLKSLSYSSTLYSNFEKIDTLRTFQTQWKESANQSTIQNEKGKLYQWLKYKLNLDTLVVK
ncbi:MAG: DUF389 domain-containing protein [Flavobacteriaceae bacterium]|nr:DUF389 domain-containing protein [Flavobacteriaceae bacterium]